MLPTLTKLTENLDFILKPLPHLEDQSLFALMPHLGNHTLEEFSLLVETVLITASNWLDMLTTENLVLTGLFETHGELTGENKDSSGLPLDKISAQLEIMPPLFKPINKSLDRVD